jgi:antirestriction protein ArdC
MSKMNPVYQRITDRIVEALEAGTLPWRRTWDEGNDAGYGMPHNATTGRPYRGMNVWLLMMEAEDKGYTSTGWITPNQAKKFELDFTGAKTCEVVWWKKSTYTDEDTGEKRTFMYCKSFRVLNLDQCDGDKSKLKGHKSLEIPEEISEVDDLTAAISAGLEIKIKHGGDRAFYQPARDFIQMPPQKAFHGDTEYRATLLHESVHATGHESRCNREFGGRFGDESYAFEELVAELGSTYLQASLDIPMDLPHHASYLASWLKVLKGDPKAIMTAASKAQQAVDHLLDKLDITEAPVYEEAA